VAIYDQRDFIWTVLNLLVLEMIHANFCPIWCRSSWEEHFLNIFLNLETSFEQSWIPKFAPCQISMHCGQWFIRRSPFIWTNLNPHPPSMFPIKFGWNWLCGSWEKVNRWTDGRRTNCDGNSSLEPSVQVS